MYCTTIGIVIRVKQKVLNKILDKRREPRATGMSQQFAVRILIFAQLSSRRHTTFRIIVLYVNSSTILSPSTLDSGVEWTAHCLTCMHRYLMFLPAFHNHDQRHGTSTQLDCLATSVLATPVPGPTTTNAACPRQLPPNAMRIKQTRALPPPKVSAQLDN